MPYPIFRMEKCKGGRIAAMNKHHERTKDFYKSNPDIDTTRTSQNYHLIQPLRLYKQEVDSRIAAAGCKTRRDSVRMIDVLIGATPEFMTALPKEECREYFTRALSFLKEEVGDGNLITAVVHMDEKTPHMHVCFTPITKDKRLSTREIFGGRAGLSAWQDRFHSYMSERWPVLERGRSVVETRREHLSVQLFKQATRLDKQIASLSIMLDDVSVLNIRKKKEELTAALSTLLPAADRFQKQVAALEGYERKLKLNSALMGEELREAKQENTKLFLTMKDLQRRNDEVERLLDRIPDDVLEAARAMPTRRRER